MFSRIQRTINSDTQSGNVYDSTSEEDSRRDVLEELDGILNITKNIKLTNQNARLVNSLKNLKKDFDNNSKLLKNTLKQSKVNIKYNAVVDTINEIQNKLNSSDSTERNTYLDEVLKIDIRAPQDTESYSKKIYYKVISKMMDFFIAKTEFIYDSINRTVENINEIIESSTPLINNQLNDQPCYKINYSYGNLDLQEQPISQIVKDEFKKNGKIRVTSAGFYYKDFEYLKNNLETFKDVPLFLIRNRIWGYRYFVTTLEQLNNYILES